MHKLRENAQRHANMHEAKQLCIVLFGAVLRGEFVREIHSLSGVRKINRQLTATGGASK